MLPKIIKRYISLSPSRRYQVTLYLTGRKTYLTISDVRVLLGLTEYGSYAITRKFRKQNPLLTKEFANHITYFIDLDDLVQISGSNKAVRELVESVDEECLSFDAKVNEMIEEYVINRKRKIHTEASECLEERKRHAMERVIAKTDERVKRDEEVYNQRVSDLWRKSDSVYSKKDVLKIRKIFEK